MLTLLAKLLKALNSDDNPSQIALAVVFAAFLGLTPLATPHNAVFLLLALVLRINLTMCILSLGLFTLIAYLIDPVSHMIGLSLLQAQDLQPLWTTLYNNSFWRFMAFNNSLVLGSFTLTLLLSPLLFISARWLILNYRNQAMTWVKKTRLAVWLQGSKFYSLYNTIKN
ncbi:MAG: TIGR03546 family protein [Pseudomonadales bacterium]